MPKKIGHHLVSRFGGGEMERLLVQPLRVEEQAVHVEDDGGGYARIQDGAAVAYTAAGGHEGS
jgi:hypothetical protein